MPTPLDFPIVKSGFVMKMSVNSRIKEAKFST